MSADEFRAKLVPELIVSNLANSVTFWCRLLGFRMLYERPGEGFVYLDLDGAQVMLEQRDDAQRQWITAMIDSPFGRGVNFQIETANVDVPLEKLTNSGWPLYMDAEEKWYRTGAYDVGVRQFLVQDPDGYLIRMSSSIGQRPALNTRTDI